MDYYHAVAKFNIGDEVRVNKRNSLVGLQGEIIEILPHNLYYKLRLTNEGYGLYPGDILTMHSWELSLLY